MTCRKSDCIFGLGLGGDEMRLWVDSLAHAASLATGCVWLAYGGGDEAVHATTVGATGLVAIATIGQGFPDPLLH